MLTVPLPAGVVTAKSGLVKPSAVSVNVNVPVIAPPSSNPVPLVSPPNVPESFTCVTVTFTVAVAVLPLPSLIV